MIPFSLRNKPPPGSRPGRGEEYERLKVMRRRSRSESGPIRAWVGVGSSAGRVHFGCIQCAVLVKVPQQIVRHTRCRTTHQLLASLLIVTCLAPSRYLACRAVFACTRAQNISSGLAVKFCMKLKFFNFTGTGKKSDRRCERYARERRNTPFP